MAAFARMGALSTRNDDPAHGRRPFDIDRDGFVMGEGAGFLVLEALGPRRGPRRHASTASSPATARTCDARHITAPAAGRRRRRRLHASRRWPTPGSTRRRSRHINAHGTSTPLNDAAEAEAIAKVFGAGGPPVTSTKGVTGHLVGAAGAVEAVIGPGRRRDGHRAAGGRHVPRSTRPSTSTSCVGEPRAITPGPVLSNSFGFGGHNATLVLVPA